jgi:SAM-dependent methyltransferase
MKEQIQKLSHHKVADYYTSGDYWQGLEDTDSTYKVDVVDSLLQQYKIPLSTQIKAAEVGCGQGAFLFPLAEYFDQKKINYQLQGYDISPQAINLAQAKNKNLDKLLFTIGSTDDIPTLLRDRGFVPLQEGTTLLSGIPAFNKLPLGILNWGLLLIFGCFPWKSGEAYISVWRKSLA